VLLLAHAAYVVRTKINLRTIFRPAFIGALLVIPIAFVAVSPYSILRRAEILQGYERLAARAAAGDLGYTRPDLWWPLYTDSLDWGLTFTSGGFIWEIGLLTMALAAVGLCVAYYKKSWPMFWLVGGTFLVFYLVTAGYVRMSAIKRFLPLVPLVALAAAYGIYNLPLFLRSFSPQVVRVFQGILVALIVIPNSWAIAGFNVAYSHGSTHLEAVAWFREHIPKGTTLLQHGPLILLSPDDPDYRVVRLNEVYASLNAADPEVAHDRAKPLEEWIAKEHVQVVYLDARMVDRYYDTTSMRLFPETTASYRAFYDSIRREGKLLYRAEPKLWEIAGPGIELYEVSPLMPTP